MGMINVRQPDFGRRLRQLRVERGLSQRDVAVGVVNPSYISLLESGSRMPTLDVVLHIARTMNVPLGSLVDGPMLAASGVGEKQNEGLRLVRDILARSSVDFGDLDDAQARFERAYQAARTEGALIPTLEYGIALRDVLQLKARIEACYELLTELTEVAAESDVLELQIRVQIDRAAAARDMGRMDEALQFAERASSAIENTELKGTTEHVRLLGVLVSIYCDSGNVADVSKFIDEMLAVAEKLGSGAIIGRAHWAACVAYSRLGKADGVRQHVRQAREMLATPTTPLRETARFYRSAASALLDANADLDEVQPYLTRARAALDMVDLPSEMPLITSVEARYSLAAGDPKRALKLADAIDADSPMTGGFERMRLHLVRGRAMHKLGRGADAAEELRRAAELCEEMGSYRLAIQVWRELDAIRSA